MTRLARAALGLAALALASHARAAGPNDILPEGPGKDVVVRACTSCHQAPQVVARPRSAQEWDETIAKMVDRGARLTDAEYDAVYAYLARHFGPPAASTAAKAGSAKR